MARDQNLAREMESLKTGLKGLAMEAHRENYSRLLQKLDESMHEIDSLKEEFSHFVAEVRSNREAIEDLRMGKASPRGEPRETGTPSDIALLTRDIETLKTRVRWLESKATLPNIENLRARVEALENQLGSMRTAVPTVIE